jgi:carboxypeptidase C (cathepsin A)
MGESYGGKYAASLAHRVLTENKFVQPELQVNLTGLGLGNGFCDPINMIHWGDFLFTIGMAGYEERDRFRELAQAARIQIKREKWVMAARVSAQTSELHFASTLSWYQLQTCLQKADHYFKRSVDDFFKFLEVQCSFWHSNG